MGELSLPIRQRGALVKAFVRVAGSAAECGPFPAYLDTGASVTVLDAGVIRALGAEPVGEAGLHVLGRDGVSHHGVYQVEVALADTAERKWVTLDVLDGTVNPKGTAAALGRDFLEHFTLVYDGPGRKFHLRG
ncbi:MAG: retroviral-like aspartic protease family protein [Gemmataceae bacterium]|nr:retroviral-like aspartic protease family protein [Gemmataceae bacterium]